MIDPSETLARVYAFILGWSDSSEGVTDISEKSCEEVESADWTLARDEQSEK